MLRFLLWRTNTKYHFSKYTTFILVMNDKHMEYIKMRIFLTAFKAKGKHKSAQLIHLKCRGFRITMKKYLKGQILMVIII